MDNQSPICGGQHSLDQSCYAHDQCPYQQQPSMDPLQYEQSQQFIAKMWTLCHLQQHGKARRRRCPGGGAVSQKKKMKSAVLPFSM